MTLLTAFLVAYLHAQDVAPSAHWHGFETRRIPLSGNESATLVMPKTPAAPGRPWVWQSNLYEGPVTGRVSAPALALLEKGWHVVACSLSNTFGAPSALKTWDELYGVVTRAYGLSRKPVLVGLSREGLAPPKRKHWLTRRTQ